MKEKVDSYIFEMKPDDFYQLNHSNYYSPLYKSPSHMMQWLKYWLDSASSGSGFNSTIK